MNKYYVYVHYRESDLTPFYVGKGSGKRAWDFVSKGRNPYWHKVKNKHGIKVEIIFENLLEEEAFQCEIDTILEFKYFGYKLTNLTDGGEGQSGLKFTDRQRLNISNGLKGRTPWNKTQSKKKPIKRRLKSSGDLNHYADKTIYEFIRLVDGLVFKGTRSQLCTIYSVERGLIKKLFYKNPRKSADGWRLKGNSE